MTRTIVFTGGGSAGHVTVNLALLPHFRNEGWNIHYIGSAGGIERELTEGLPGVTYHSIATGKLRRYLDWNNVKDPFKVVKGVWQSYRLMKKLKPDIVFSKGGFVSVPVVMGAWMNKVPAIIHESDLTPGLANKLSIPFAKRVCTTFPETKKHISGDKTVHVGAVVREDLFKGKEEKGLQACGFTKGKPVLLIMGGSLGSQRINKAVRDNLAALSEQFQIVHLCGKGNAEPALESGSYRQFEYLKDELPDILAMTDLVISRAGSNSIYEFLALRKPMLLIPLSKAASRGDQILNAESFRSRGFASVLEEESLTNETLLKAVRFLAANKENYLEAMRRQGETDALAKLIRLIEETARSSHDGGKR
ncbi:undecaprenyldiphospho-muramoylpentapeptide beta-N-acetylglucosaminyltransferase [Paenibacillus thermotolerans]|uniref:undecaprenyldiphospho-muramoylpentapeptide beta-N-acetylglucosaminyltransferase n=1 Tax=Paenibacillus thermotolerans TaxID=3027807 RepID=UPI002368BD35|nr:MULTISPECIES: undecaprenyldiphospho-muramoylpentapeptide beta-N-acetylglucosaminyltransferase [unclassified Paenibacillus]